MKEKLDKLKSIIKKIRINSVSFDELLEMCNLFDELGVYSKIEFDEFLSLRGLDINKLYKFIVDKQHLGKDERIKISGVFGTFSGLTVSIYKEFVYGKIIEKYYNGDKRTFMEEKEEYKLKIDRMFELISLMKEKVITFGQLNEFIDTIKELSILTDSELSKLLEQSDYKNIIDLYEAIDKYKSSDNINRTKVSNVISNLSAAAYTAHIKYVQNYDEFINDIKNKNKVL